MSRPLILILILALVVVAGGLGYQVYKDRQKPDGVQIDIGKTGVTIQSN